MTQKGRGRRVGLARLMQVALCMGVAMVVAASSPAWAADKETREFHIAVDGKSAGNCTMTFSRNDDGAVTMTCQASLKVRRVLFYNFEYTYQGTEVWKDGRLSQFKSSTNDNGTRYAVTAWADGDALKVQVNGKIHSARWDVWTTSFSRLPDAKYLEKTVPLLDADTGKNLSGTLQYVDSQRLNVAGREQDCAHYRVSGDEVEADLWYDAQGRLVRRDSVEDKHRMVLELTQIQR
jgi:Family of unknown function (DUF6134)